MNNYPSHSEQTIERFGPPPKKGFGCLINTLIGIAIFAVAIVTAIWLIIMHSSLPLRTVANLIEKGGADSNVKITGLSGSLASGLSFKTLKWDDGEITDVRFRYSGLMDIMRSKELIIHEMHVGSATLNTTFFTDSSEETATESTSEPSSKGDSTDPPLRLFQIDRVSLNQIFIKNSTTGKTIAIPKIEWIGFKAEKGAPLEWGNFEADSDHLVIKTSNPTASNFQKRVEIILMPKLDARILKPIRIDAYLGEKADKPIFDIKAFDETVTLTTGADGKQHLSASGVNLADFIDAPLPNKFNLDTTITKTDAASSTLSVRSGSFVLGIQSFTIQPNIVTGSVEMPEGTAFIALCRTGETEIRYEIPVNETKDQEQLFTPILTSTPTMNPEDLMALLFHDQKFSTLPPTAQEQLHKHMSWFSFSK